MCGAWARGERRCHSKSCRCCVGGEVILEREGEGGLRTGVDQREGGLRAAGVDEVPTAACTAEAGLSWVGRVGAVGLGPLQPAHKVAGVVGFRSPRVRALGVLVY